MSAQVKKQNQYPKIIVVRALAKRCFNHQEFIWICASIEHFHHISHGKVVGNLILGQCAIVISQVCRHKLAQQTILLHQVPWLCRSALTHQMRLRIYSAISSTGRALTQAIALFRNREISQYFECFPPKSWAGPVYKILPKYTSEFVTSYHVNRKDSWTDGRHTDRRGSQ